MPSYGHLKGSAAQLRCENNTNKKNTGRKKNLKR